MRRFLLLGLCGVVLACEGRADGVAAAASGAASARAAVSGAPGSPGPAGSGAAPSPEAASIAFVRPAPRVGQKRVERATTTLNLTGEVAAGKTRQSIDLTNHEEREVEVEVLAVDKGVETALRVTYRYSRRSQGGKAAQPPVDLAGKAFRVEAKAGKIVVTTAEGGALPAAVSGAVAEDFRSLGEPNPMEAALPERPLREGEALDSMSGALMAVLARGQKTAPKLSDARVVLERIEGAGPARLGVIGFTVRAEFLQDGILMDLRVKGRFTVRAVDSRLAATEIVAPVTLTAAPGQAFTVSGKGQLLSSSTLNYP